MTAKQIKEQRRYERRLAKARKGAPTWTKACAAYWSQYLYEGDLGTDFDEADVRCWRCSRMVTLQKCHIIPKSLGGTDGPDNIVPLCSWCHDEMPNVGDASAVWAWIKRTRATFYDSFESQNAVDLAKSMGVDFARVDMASVVQLLREASSSHFVQNGGGPKQGRETMLWAILNAAQLIKPVANKWQWELDAESKSVEQ